MNSDGDIFRSIPEGAVGEIFTELASSNSVRIERIVSRGHSSPASGWYDEEENEWVVVLKGEARVLFEFDGEVHLGPGKYLNIPAHKRHKVVWTAAETETVWLAVHYK